MSRQTDRLRGDSFSCLVFDRKFFSLDVVRLKTTSALTTETLAGAPQELWLGLNTLSS